MRRPRERLAMLPNRLRIGAIAAWLGVIALGLNALVPIHLAFDLAHALAPAQPDAAADHDLVRLRADAADRAHDESQRAVLAAPRATTMPTARSCGAIGTLAGFAPAAVVSLRGADSPLTRRRFRRPIARAPRNCCRRPPTAPALPRSHRPASISIANPPEPHLPRLRHCAIFCGARLMRPTFAAALSPRPSRRCCRRRGAWRTALPATAFFRPRS